VPSAPTAEFAGCDRAPQHPATGPRTGKEPQALDILIAAVILTGLGVFAGTVISTV